MNNIEKENESHCHWQWPLDDVRGILGAEVDSILLFFDSVALFSLLPASVHTGYVLHSNKICTCFSPIRFISKWWYANGILLLFFFCFLLFATRSSSIPISISRLWMKKSFEMERVFAWRWRRAEIEREREGGDFSTVWCYRHKQNKTDTQHCYLLCGDCSSFFFAVDRPIQSGWHVWQWWCWCGGCLSDIAIVIVNGDIISSFVFFLLRCQYGLCSTEQTKKESTRTPTNSIYCYLLPMSFMYVVLIRWHHIFVVVVVIFLFIRVELLT